jgi:DNA-directed RNA polymerase subunit RPC12/RpoP
LPADRTNLQAVGIQSRGPLSGDFEITASYEFLSSDRPAKGKGRFGIGVNLLISTDSEMQKFAKIARFWLPEEGNGYVGDFTLRRPQPIYDSKFVPTEATLGQLRLKREGSTLRYLVADLGQEFREIYQADFGTQDIGFIRYVVNTGNLPTAVDVRLVDVKIRSGSPKRNPVVEAEVPSDTPQSSLGNVWLASGILLQGMVFAVGTWMYARRSAGAAKPAPAASPMVSFACSACGKNLKARSARVGTRAKCPHCGQAVLVPEKGSQADQSA